MRFIEKHERSARLWYGGAVGLMGFNGNMNTALTLRTIQLKDGVAAVRAGATLLYDSDPAAEEAETRLKAEALLDVIRRPEPPVLPAAAPASAALTSRRILLVDHEDSFVHTLGNYFRRAGGDVVTMRAGRHLQALDAFRPALVVLSPGPGRPDDFAMRATIDQCRRRGLPIFGVCLGLQGIVEYFGGSLDILDEPMHGKASEVTTEGGRLFAGLPPRLTVGRYHSLHARKADFPACLRVTALSTDGVIMALEHESEPIHAVQFHPESLMTLKDDAGMRIIHNLLSCL
jgi:anthranilate synthase